MSEDFISLGAILEKLQVERMHLEMHLGMSIGDLARNSTINDPETQALFRLLYHMPWLLEVAQSGFDREEADKILLREAIKAKANLDMGELCGY